jgi:hypothetical protein
VHKLQELLGGAYGEMTVAMRYLFQGRNCRMPGRCKDLIMDIATEEVGHVEMIATMVARLLEGALATATTKAAAADPVVGAVLDGMDPQQPSSPGGVAAQAAVGRGWSSLCCLHAHAVNASQLGGQLRAAPFPASLLFDSYLPLVFLGFRSNRLTALP